MTVKIITNNNRLQYFQEKQKYTKPIKRQKKIIKMKAKTQSK